MQFVPSGSSDPDAVVPIHGAAGAGGGEGSGGSGPGSPSESFNKKAKRKASCIGGKPPTKQSITTMLAKGIDAQEDRSGGSPSGDADDGVAAAGAGGGEAVGTGGSRRNSSWRRRTSLWFAGGRSGPEGAAEVMTKTERRRVFCVDAIASLATETTKTRPEESPPVRSDGRTRAGKMLRPNGNKLLFYQIGIRGGDGDDDGAPRRMGVPRRVADWVACRGHVRCPRQQRSSCAPPSRSTAC